MPDLFYFHAIRCFFTLWCGAFEDTIVTPLFFSLLFAFWYDKKAFQNNPPPLRNNTRFRGGQYMKFIMFATGQNTEPAINTSYHVSVNFRTPPESPLPSSPPIHTLNRKAYEGKRKTCPSATFFAAAFGHVFGPTTRSMIPRVLLLSFGVSGVIGEDWGW